MVRFTLLEVDLDGVQFDAEAPFSRNTTSEAAEEVNGTLEEQLQQEADTSGSGTSPVLLLVGFLTLAGFVVAARKALSRHRSGEEQTEAAEPIVAD